MRNSPYWWIIVAFMVLLDIYFFQALRTITLSASPRLRLFIHSGYWVISVAAILLFILLPYLKFEKHNSLARSTLFSLLIGFFFAKLVASVFFLFDDVRRGVQWSALKLISSPDTKLAMVEQEKITRSLFLSWAGMVAGSGLLGSLIYGFTNKYRYQVVRHQLNFPQLPAGFKGLKIAQVSDIHSGSFTDKEAVNRGIDKILAEQPDIILFTGDLVNNVSDEMDDYMDVFSRLRAPMGVYSVLGNHDYGDYVKWDSETDKKANLDRMVEIHRELGWNLLMNEHVVLERGGEEIALLGIENWSAKARFPRYGDLGKAHAGAREIPFKILLSHDPSHWKAEVLESYPDIALMLSGHTHGMQFGVEIPGLKWSPAQYIYREWAGLYETESQHQKLYVNRGFGFLGYPGRVGILPEITILELS